MAAVLQASCSAALIGLLLFSTAERLQPFPRGLFLEKTQADSGEDPRELKLNGTQEVELNRPQEVKLNQPQEVTLNHTQEVKLNFTQEVKLNSTQEVKLNSTQEVKLNSAQEVKLDRTPETKLNRTRFVESCTHFPAPPFDLPGKYQDPAFTAWLPFNKGLLFTLQRDEKVFNSLLPVLQKLATGTPVRISILGGSFTAGILCKQGIFDGKMCSWPARLLEWLHLAFPLAQIQFENLAQGGSASSVFLAGIGVTLITEPGGQTPDLVILDTLVNDAYEGQASGAKMAAEHTETQYSDHDIISMTYEMLVRAIKELYPEASFLSVFDGCNKCREIKRAQAEVSEHYGIPEVDFASLVDRQRLLWDCPGDCTHPSWRSHQAVADAIAYALGTTWEKFCYHLVSAPEGIPPPVPLMQSRWPSAALSRFSVCLRPLSVYRARSPRERPVVAAGNWTLYEDRPGKPGWISSTPGSVLRFPLRFGRVAKLTIEYLRSYEGMGRVQMRMNNRAATLDGLWAPGHERVSQGYVVNCAASEPVMQADLDGVLGFGIPPYSEETLEIEVMPAQGNPFTKFKIMNVLSC